MNNLISYYIKLLKQQAENALKNSGNKLSKNGGFHYEEGINRNRSPSKMTKYIECWGADKPFANITESTMAKNIGLAVSIYRVQTDSY